MHKLALICLVAAACNGKTPVDDDVSSAFQADAKADLPTNTRFLGNLGGKPAPVFPVAYSKKPLYRSVGFWGVAGDVWDIHVTSPDGDAVAWLLDFQGNVLASNDDASADTLDSFMHVTLGPSNGHYFIYFRDYWKQKAHFTVTATGGHPADPAGDAERAWDAATAVDNGPDQDKVAATLLPATPHAQWAKYDAKTPGASAWKIPTLDGTGYYWAVGDAVEEVSWVDLYSSAGTFLVHGANGDGGWQMTFWGDPRQSWDPSSGY
jgi:hypothetical protein